MITINGNSIETAAPDDLDARLVADTGFGAHEAERLIGAGPDLASRALAPFLVDGAPSTAALAVEIGADPKARDAIRALYATLPVTAPAPEPIALATDA